MRIHFEEGERAVLATRLGLDENADDAAVTQAVANWVQEDPNSAPTPTPTPTPVAASNNADDVPDDGSVVVVDVASFRRLQDRDRIAAEVEETMRRRDRDELIEEAIHDGKFSPSRRDHYRARYDDDAEGTAALIGRLTPNTVPLVERGSNAQDDNEVDETAYPKEWVPELAAQHSQGPPQRPASRVHSE